MKKLILIGCLGLFSFASHAQKFAYVDSDYILERVPEYQSAQEQLDKLTLSWQEDIEQLYQEIDQLYKKYQADQILLTQDMKVNRENEIINKEKGAKRITKKKDLDLKVTFYKRQELVNQFRIKFITLYKI